MKKLIFSLACGMITAGVLFTSCNSEADKLNKSQEKVEEAQQDLAEAKEDCAVQYERFRIEQEEQITANEKLIIDLKEYSKAKKSEAKVNYDKTIAELEVKNQAMKVKVRDYKAEGDDKWKSFKEEFNHDMKELGQSIKDLTIDNKK